MFLSFAAALLPLKKTAQEHQPYPAYLDHRANRCIYACCRCHCHIMSHHAIMSRSFHGRFGTDYLVSDVVNVEVGVQENRIFTTVAHTVADIACRICDLKLGWKYLSAVENPQKYKEGRYIIERAKVTRQVEWEDDDFM